MCQLGDTLFKIFIWGGKSLDIPLEKCYSYAQREPYNVISKRISDDMAPQMKNLNMAIKILKHFYSLVSIWSVASHMKRHKGVCHPMKCDVNNNVKLFPTVYC